MVHHEIVVVGLYVQTYFTAIWSNIRIFCNSEHSRPWNHGRITWSCIPCTNVILSKRKELEPFRRAPLLADYSTGNTNFTKDAKSNHSKASLEFFEVPPSCPRNGHTLLESFSEWGFFQIFSNILKCYRAWSFAGVESAVVCFEAGLDPPFIRLISMYFAP